MAASHAEEPHGLGARLRQARERRGLSQRDLARRARVTYSAIALLESGERTGIGLEQLRRLARVLRVTTDYLLEMDRPDEDRQAVAVARL